MYKKNKKINTLISAHLLLKKIKSAIVASLIFDRTVLVSEILVH